MFLPHVRICEISSFNRPDWWYLGRNRSKSKRSISVSLGFLWIFFLLQCYSWFPSCVVFRKKAVIVTLGTHFYASSVLWRFGMFFMTCDLQKKPVEWQTLFLTFVGGHITKDFEWIPGCIWINPEFTIPHWVLALSYIFARATWGPVCGTFLHWN